jgi:hypothetical protein
MTVSFVLLRVLEKECKMTNIDSGELFDYFKYHFSFQRGRVQSNPAIRTKTRAPRKPRVVGATAAGGEEEGSHAQAHAPTDQLAAAAVQQSPVRSTRKRAASASATAPAGASAAAKAIKLPARGGMKQNILKYFFFLLINLGIKKPLPDANEGEGEDDENATQPLPLITRVLFEHDKFGYTTEEGVVHGRGVVAKKDLIFSPTEKQVNLL